MNMWYADIAAFDYITTSHLYFVSYEKFSVPKSIVIGNGQLISAYGKAIINAEM